MPFIGNLLFLVKFSWPPLNFHCFRRAARNSHLDVVKYLCRKSESAVLAVVAENFQREKPTGESVILQSALLLVVFNNNLRATPLLFPRCCQEKVWKERNNRNNWNLRNFTQLAEGLCLASHKRIINMHIHDWHATCASRDVMCGLKFGKENNAGLTNNKKICWSGSTNGNRLSKSIAFCIKVQPNKLIRPLM